MRLITISGARKNIGKTTMAVHLIKALTPCYAMKCSVHEKHGHGVTSDPSLINNPGTDTGRFVAAGAKGTWWLKSDGRTHCDELEKLVQSFGSNDLVIAEGNSIIKCLKPDFAIFIAGQSIYDLKPSAVAAMNAADLIVFHNGADLNMEVGAAARFNDAATIMTIGRERKDYEDIIEMVRVKIFEKKES